jgi:hypothetical protein
MPDDCRRGALMRGVERIRAELAIARWRGRGRHLGRGNRADALSAFPLDWRFG